MSDEKSAPPVVAGEYDDYAAMIASARFTAAYAKRVNEIAKVDPVFLDAMADALAAMQTTVILTERQSNVLTVDLHAAQARIAALEGALTNLIAACDAGRRVEKGVGGMTIDAQLMRTVINGVSAWAVEEARAALKGGDNV